MLRHKTICFLSLTAVVCVVSMTDAHAEDTKGKWQFGFGISYFSTTDYIRSNADIAISDGTIGAQGIPPTFPDERPDINILNKPTIQDDFKLDFNVSYGLTRWLALEMAAGYQRSPVGDIEFYTRDQTVEVTPPAAGVSLCGPSQNGACWGYTRTLPHDVRTNSFLPIGELTEIPVQLSGLIRFRPESPLDPYIGLGVGYIFTNLETGEL